MLGRARSGPPHRSRRTHPACRRRTLRRGDRGRRGQDRRLRDARPRGGGACRGRPAACWHAAARSAGRGQGHLRYRRPADAVWLADLRRPSAARRCRRGGDGAARRRLDPRQDGDHRICLDGAGRHPQSAKPGAYAGRLVVGFRRRRRRRHGADRARQSDRRLGHPAGGVLRRRRVQAVVPADPDRRHEMLLLAARYRGFVRRRCRRCRLRGGGNHRPRFARRPRRTGGAAHRTSPHASVAAGECGDAQPRSKPPPAPRKRPVRR